MVRVGTAVKLDPSGKKAGRGAYICAKQECLDLALRRNGPARALRIRITDSDLDEIKAGARKCPRGVSS